MLHRLKALAKWTARWLVLVLLICAAGALVGGILFPLAGFLLGMDLTVGEMVRNGLADGGFLALIWAPGVALVACIMWAHAKAGRNGDRIP